MRGRNLWRFGRGDHRALLVCGTHRPTDPREDLDVGHRIVSQPRPRVADDQVWIVFIRPGQEAPRENMWTRSHLQRPLDQDARVNLLRGHGGHGVLFEGHGAKWEVRKYFAPSSRSR